MKFAVVFLSWLIATPLLAATTPLPPLSAKWIWHSQSETNPYNQAILARKTFRLPAMKSATLRITADTWYRLKVNGRWLADGPSRSWPNHFQYDVLDVASELRPGPNTIEVTARYFGVGDFHHIPQRPGLLVQLDAETANGKTLAIHSDQTWETALLNALVPNTPKVSIQMEPVEWYDARLEGQGRWRRAAVLFDANAGPWKNLNPRDVRMMTLKPASFRTFIGANLVRSEGIDFCLPAARLVHPQVIEANHNVSLACGMATVLNLAEPTTFSVRAEGFKVAIDGVTPKDQSFSLAAGKHLVLVLAREVVSHAKEKSIRFSHPNLRFQNPLQPGHENPWVFLRFPEAVFSEQDIPWIEYRNPKVQEKIDWFDREADRLLKEVNSVAAFPAQLAQRAELLPLDTMFVKDSVWRTWERQVTGPANEWVQNPSGLIGATPDAVTTVWPTRGGDVELVYDLGEQNCGYYQLTLDAPAGVVLDLVGVEYMSPEGRVQWSHGNRNGMRYITRAGRNEVVSLKRRSGRYVFLTLRNVTQPVRISSLSLIESTYPVEWIGSFACSDARLERIWDISARTLKLCMEDTFTDCPLYEQTHWVGDARNESLFAYTVFGATDIGARCARQTAQSLELYPIAGAQVPSSWECLLPAWSFLWGISTWDYYWQTGDKAFLQEMHGAVIKNLRGAARFQDERGLFSAPFWNFFDWTRIDQGQPTVLHNSMILVGAIDAALKSEAALGCREHQAWLTEFRARLVKALNGLWDPAKGAYPDSIRKDGTISPSTCQHTSFLSVLYDILDPANLDQAKRNMIAPPEGMVRLGSPFGALYLYEALEKMGMEHEIVRQIYLNYLPMLEAGATTVWESFPSGTTGSGGFPTRSHCHAWSSAPLYFLNRAIVGLKPASVGWATATLSPHLGDISWARGTTATPHGPVEVAWKLQGDTLAITCKKPSAISVKFVSNDSLKGKKVTLNGESVQ